MARGGIMRPAGDMASVTLPVPPSVNGLYRNVPGRGRVKTKEYSDWFARGYLSLRHQIWEYVPGKVLLCMKVSPQGPLADLDNRIKAAQDLLVKARVIDDDRHVVGLTACWGEQRDDLVRIAVLKAADHDFCFRLSATGGGGSWFLMPPLEEAA
jgi:Holliday junction resolvase RusA-like endonuclease